MIYELSLPKSGQEIVKQFTVMVETIAGTMNNVKHLSLFQYCALDSSV
jgi:hypothetical protein